MSKQIVYIVDDDKSVRKSIKGLVESVGLKAMTFASPLEFLDIYNSSRRGCLVLDIRMARMSGLELQKKLNDLDGSMPIIFITGYGDVSVAVKAIKAGALDFMEKPYNEINLLDSINNALQTDLENHSCNNKQLVINKKLSSLTKRESEVMEQLVNVGANNKVAELLGISPRTIEVHRQRVMKKLGVKSLTELKVLLRE